MAATSRPLIFPTREVIIRLNRRHINKYGGVFNEPDNLLHPGGLDWVLDVIQGEMADRIENGQNSIF